MQKHILVPALVLLGILSQFQFGYAQKEKPWMATRCSGVDRARAINNIAIGSDNSKFISNSKSIYQAKACDLTSLLPGTPGEENVLAFWGGNTNFTFSKEALSAAIGGSVDLVSAWYDEGDNSLLLGTSGDGLFFFNTQNGLQLEEQINSGNSKMKSSHITQVFKDKRGLFWVGTKEGVMVGDGSKWKFDLSGYGVQRIREFGNDVYVLADGELWIVEGGSKWQAIVLDDGVQEREIYDFDVAPNGKIWILSAVVAEYDWFEDTYKIYAGPQDYTSEFGTCLAADKDGEIWVGTQDKGLYRIGPENDMDVLCEVDQFISCKGSGNDGALKVKISGGVAPYTYTWSDAAVQGENPQGLNPGKYAVTVSDSKGLEASAEVELADPRMTLVTKVLKPESALGAGDGSAEVTVSGGSPRYKYKWDSGESKSTAYKLGEGVHSITVTDGEGCEATATVNVTQIIAELNVRLEEATPIKCAGEKSAELKAVVEGGKAPYTFTWSNPAWNSEKASGVGAGKYVVTVTDVQGNTASSTITLAQPAPLSAVALVRASANVNAADGKADVQVQGGSGTYSFAWDNGETTQEASRLAAGNHSVTVTDGNGCTKTGSVSITEDILPLKVTITLVEEIRCAQDQGKIQVQVEGGKGPFKYAWNQAGLSGQGPVRVAKGGYTVTVTDAEGTTLSGSLTVDAPSPLKANAVKIADASTDNTDGEASVKIEGGVPPYAISWDNGESQEKASALAPGVRTVEVSDANGCKSTSQVEIKETIQPLKVTLEATTPIACNGEQSAGLKAIVKGGKKPYQYQWNNPEQSGGTLSNLAAGTYALTITDGLGTQAQTQFEVKEPEALKANSIQLSPATTNKTDASADIKARGGTAPYTYKWDNGEEGVKAIELGPGTHQFTVTDANGCTVTNSVEITEDIQPLILSLNEEEAIKCAENPIGSILAEVRGGKPPYKYTWNTPSITGEKASGLKAGVYAVTVSDVAGTSQQASIELKSPEPLVINLIRKVGASEDWTNDGRATIEVTGGTTPYKIEWNNGESTLAAKNLDIGSNTVTVSDVNGCKTDLSMDIEKRILPELTPGMLRNGQTIRMERLQFEADSSRLTPECIPVLDEVFDFLLENTSIVIEIGGHTNNIPPDEFCDRLSTARAKSVAAYLVEKGIEEKRVVYKGYGKRSPIASNSTADGRKRNQRVEIKILRVN
ncbi:MAG: OmpA family protein [Saprospiraceae bacterium]